MYYTILTFLRGCKSKLSHKHAQFQVSLTNRCRVITSNLVITLPLIICQPRWWSRQCAWFRLLCTCDITLNPLGKLQDQGSGSARWHLPFLHIHKSESALNVGSYCDNPRSPGETARIRQQCGNASGDLRWNTGRYACIYMVVDSQSLH